MAEKMTVEKAAGILGQGFHCSQCVMWHTAEALGMDKKQALKMTGGLGGGCFHGDVCGAVSAGVASLGLKYGYCEPNSAEQNAILISKVNELEARFIEKNGSIVCKELLGGLSFAVPEEAAKIMENGLAGVIKNCPKYCADVCEILDDMIDELK